VTVGLSGDGGDEVFAGYNRHLWLGRLWNRSRLMPRFILQLLAAVVLVLPPKRWEQVLRRLEPILPEWTKQRLPGDKLHKMAELLTSDNQIELYLGVASHWWAPQQMVIGASEPATVITDAQNWPALSDFTELMIYLDTMTYLPDDILVKLDRASMAVSLEARVPLLDHRIVEFAWQLPMQMKIRGGVGKWVLRQVLKRYVPDELIHRPKMGFGLPLGPWLLGPLRDWAESLLSEQRLRQDGYFEAAPIRQRWSEHVRGTRNWSYHIWDVLMFQEWLQENRRSPEVNDRPSTAVATTTRPT
jgi:asparagine synthase (glutamine-hydrolysing)